MSDLPPGWEWATFADVAEVASNLVDPADYQDAPHVAPNHIESWTGRLLPFSTIAHDGVTSNKHRFLAGQLLYSKIRPYLAKAVSVDFSGLCSADMYPVNSFIDTNFLKWWMLTPAFTEAASKHQGRSVLPKINAKALATLPVPVAPLAEQRQIVSSLEDHLSRLDAGLRSLANVKRRAMRLRDSVTEAALHGNLSQPLPEDGEIAAYVAALNAARTSRVGRRRSTPVSIAKFMELNTPSHWTIVPLDSLCWDIQYGTSAKAATDSTGPTIPVIRMGNIRNGKLDGTDLKYLPVDHKDVATLRLTDGDILFNRTNSLELVGKTAAYRDSFGPAVFASYLIRCRLVAGINPDWISLAINSPTGRKYIQSVASQQVGQANVNGKKLAAMPIPLPTLAEQNRIVETVNGMLESADRTTEIIASAERKWSQVRRSLLMDAFSGRLVAQDPDDEPASALLDSIRSKRGARQRPKRTRAKTTIQETLL
jgi:type I restriction enzyme S subunit